MSKEQKVSETAQEEKEKVITKYDLKVQRRKEEKEREERAKKVSTTTTIVILVALVCLVLSFPIRTYLTLHKTFVKVGNDDVTKVEFDYSYYTVVNNYVNSYGSYLSMFGLDPSKDLASQAYSTTMSWQDYFQEATVDNLRRSKGLKADAIANGFTYDTKEELDRYIAQMKTGAQSQGLSLTKYLQQLFGPYATLDRVKPYMEEAIFVSKYNDKLSGDFTPSKEEIDAKYAEDPKNYDTVEYKILSFDAEFPTEPTELALPEEEREYTDNADGTKTYKPSDAEKEKAMADAKAKADAALTKVKTEGEEVKGLLYGSMNTVIRDWLYDDGRKAGNTSVMEDTSMNRYYCVEFEKRYRDESATANVRILIGNDEADAQAIYDKWKSGSASEEYFIELCDGEYIDRSVDEGGLLEGVSPTQDLYEELMEWIFAEGRKAGDCEIVNVDGTASFVVYYSGEGDPAWYNTIKKNLRNDALNKYVDELKEKCEVQDPDKNLKYIEIRAAEAAAAEASAAAQELQDNSESTQSVDPDSDVVGE